MGLKVHVNVNVNSAEAVARPRCNFCRAALVDVVDARVRVERAEPDAVVPCV